MQKASSFFIKELELITDDTAKNIVIDLLDNYVHFDNIKNTSSSSMKYHPYFDNIEYGNANHTKAVVKLCNVLLSSRIDLSDFWKNVIYSSAILHDMWKYDGTSKHTQKLHDDLAYFELKKYSEKHNIESEKLIIDTIAIIIKYHMGHWNNENWITELRELTNKDLYDSILIVHYSDMIASRKFYDVKDFSL